MNKKNRASILTVFVIILSIISGCSNKSVDKNTTIYYNSMNDVNKYVEKRNNTNQEKFVLFKSYDYKPNFINIYQDSKEKDSIRIVEIKLTNNKYEVIFEAAGAKLTAPITYTTKNNKIINCEYKKALKCRIN